MRLKWFFLGLFFLGSQLCALPTDKETDITRKKSFLLLATDESFAEKVSLFAFINAREQQVCVTELMGLDRVCDETRNEKTSRRKRLSFCGLSSKREEPVRYNIKHTFVGDVMINAFNVFDDRRHVSEVRFVKRVLGGCHKVVCKADMSKQHSVKSAAYETLLPQTAFLQSVTPALQRLYRQEVVGCSRSSRDQTLPDRYLKRRLKRKEKRCRSCTSEQACF